MGQETSLKVLLSLQDTASEKERPNYAEGLWDRVDNTTRAE